MVLKSRYIAKSIYRLGGLSIPSRHINAPGEITRLTDAILFACGDAFQ